MTEINEPEEERKQDEAEKKRSRKKLAARLAAAVTGFVVISVTATEMMMFILFGRNSGPEDREFALHGWAAENGYSWHPLVFPSGDNLLKGYVIAPPEPKALMVAVHGIKSDSDALAPVVQFFVRQGYAVASFDGTASGRSEGRKTTGLQQQRLDLRACLQALRNEGLYQDLPLVLFGHSAGAYGAATEAADTGAAAVVCVSGFESPLATMRFWAEKYAGALMKIEYPFLLVRELIAKGSDADTSATGALRYAGIPAIVAQGTADDVVNEEISLYRAVSENGAEQIMLVSVDDPEHSGHQNILVSETEVNEDLLNLISRKLEPVIRRGE